MLREVLVRNQFSLLSAGTERSALEFDEKSLIAKARSRPDLVRKVIDRARREGTVEAVKAALTKLDEARPLGYSCAGYIEALGSDLVAGSLVPGSPIACAGANYANHAEFVSVPASLTASVPKGLPLDAACYVTVASIALHGVRLAVPTLGERAAVIGCGLIGQIAVQLLVANGIDVLAIDTVGAKVDMARKFGAVGGAVLGKDDVRTIAASMSDGFGVDFVLVCAATPSSDPIVLAADITRDRGRVVAVGATGLDLPRRPFYDKELSFFISRSYGPGRYDPVYEEAGIDYPIGYVRWTQGRNFEAVLDLMSKGALNVQALTTHRFPIDRATEAYELIKGGGEPFLGVLIEYPEVSSGEGFPHPGTAGAGAVHGAAMDLTRGGEGRKAVRRDASVSVLGAGGFARSVLLPAFQAASAQFATIASASGLSAADLGKKFNFKKVGRENDVIDDDAASVVILTRHDNHASLASEALRRGKNVFVEKPLAIDEDQLATVEAAMQASSAVLTVGFNRRFAPASVKLREFFSDVGEPLVMHARVNAGMIPVEHWIQNQGIGGGRIIGEGCHFIDWMTFICGAAPVEVHAMSVDAGRADFPNRDQVTISIRFANGSIGSLMYVARGDTRLAKERYEVFAGQRSAVLDDFQTLDVYRNGKNDTLWKGAQSKGHREEVVAFLEGVRRGQAPIPYDQLIAVTRATFAAEESLRSGVPVAF